MFNPIYEEVLKTPLLTWNFKKDYLYYNNMNKPLVVKIARSHGISRQSEIKFG